MARKKSRVPSPSFLKRSDDLEKAHMVVLPSLNLQINVQLKKPIPLELLQEAGSGQEKLTVQRITLPVGHSKGNIGVMLKNGQPVSFYGEIGAPITSGSAGNVAVGMRMQGVVDVAVIGSTGNVIQEQNGRTVAVVDEGGSKMLDDFDVLRIKYGIFPANITSFTLRLREPEPSRKIMLLLVKGQSVLPPDLAEFIARAMKPKIIALTSLRVDHLGFAEYLLSQLEPGREKPFVALSISSDLIKATHLRQEILKVISEADLLALNAVEACLLTGRLVGQEVDEEEILRQEDILQQVKEEPKSLVGEVAKLGARITVVTLDNAGAAVSFQGSVFIQNAFPTKEVDPAGAGDAFLATVLAHQDRHSLDSWDRLINAIREASFVASHKVGNEGPLALPTTERIRRFQQHGK